LHAQRQWDAATASFQEVIRLAPESAEAYFGLGVVCGAQGIKQEEIEHFLHALRLDPENDQYQFHVARLTGVAAPITAPLNHIRKLFDACAENFDTHLVEQLSYKGPGLVHAAVMELVGTVNKGMDVLDLGCGTGLCAPLFRPLAHNFSGIDLSERMVDVARKLNLYDHLIVGDISIALEGRNEVHDLIIAADVFIYVGELRRVFELCSAALKKPGLFAFSVEAAKDQMADFVLEPSGRYSHSRQYLRKLALSFGLEVSSIQDAVLRTEGGNPVNGYVVVMRR
jgi:predicted TPR repeat methyltransferase